MGGDLVEALARHPDLASVQLFKSRDQAKQGGFARAALAEDRQKLTGRHLERNSAQNRASGKLFFNFSNGKQNFPSSAFDGNG